MENNQLSRLICLFLLLFLHLPTEIESCSRAGEERGRTASSGANAQTSSNKCPHRTFSAKHHCPDCGDNKEEALAYAIKRNEDTRYSDTNVNTVFIGNFQDFVYDPDTKSCINANPVSTYTCKNLLVQANNPGDSRRPQGNCKFLGKCRGRHATNTGHLFYRELNCTNAAGK